MITHSRIFATPAGRKNSINGLLYKNDPTILAWNLINEPRCETWMPANSWCPEALSSWFKVRWNAELNTLCAQQQQQQQQQRWCVPMSGWPSQCTTSMWLTQGQTAGRVPAGPKVLSLLLLLLLLLQEMGDYVRTKDPNHLVSSGEARGTTAAAASVFSILILTTSSAAKLRTYHSMHGATRLSCRVAPAECGVTSGAVGTAAAAAAAEAQRCQWLLRQWRPLFKASKPAAAKNSPLSAQMQQVAEVDVCLAASAQALRASFARATPTRAGTPRHG
jgi:hypothetical protein